MISDTRIAYTVEQLWQMRNVDNKSLETLKPKLIKASANVPRGSLQGWIDKAVNSRGFQSCISMKLYLALHSKKRVCKFITYNISLSVLFHTLGPN